MDVKYDSVLGKLRGKDDVSVSDVQGLAEALQGDNIVRVADAAALAEIESPNPLLVYITNDTDDVYLHIPGTGFVNKTGTVIGDKIFVHSIEDLIDVIYDYRFTGNGWSITLKLPAENVYQVITPTVQWRLAEAYRLVVCSNLVSYLESRNGWAHIMFPSNGDSPYWNWRYFQLTEDSGLNTESKSVVGAVNEVADKSEKEMAEVASYEVLVAIENPSSAVIYITQDTKDVYLYDKTNNEFVNKTGKVVNGDLIIVKQIEDLIGVVYDSSYDESEGTWDFELKLPTNSVYRVLTPMNGSCLAENYTLVITGTMMAVLSCRMGYASVAFIQDNPVAYWNWTRYSVEGHQHQIGNIAELGSVINTINTKLTKLEQLTYAAL